MDVHPTIRLVDVPEELAVTEDGNSGLAIKKDPFFGDMGAMLGFGVHIGRHQELIDGIDIFLASTSAARHEKLFSCVSIVIRPSRLRRFYVLLGLLKGVGVCRGVVPSLPTAEAGDCVPIAPSPPSRSVSRVTTTSTPCGYQGAPMLLWIGGGGQVGCR